MLASFFVVILGLCCCFKESSQFFLGHPQLYGPNEALVKTYVEFQCEVPNHPINHEILLQIFKEDDPNKALGEYTSLEGEAANIPMVITKRYDGYLKCVASVQNRSISHINSTSSNLHYLKVIEPVKGAQIISSGPEDFFEGETLQLICQLSAGNYISYKWLHNDQLVSPSSLRRIYDNQLTIYRTNPQDSGSYKCVATNVFNKTVFTSNSSEIEITVKEFVSAPDISFTVLKEEPQNYFAIVVCNSTRGDLPITYSLYRGKEQVINMTVEERHSVFKLPLVMDRHLGFLRCHASNGEQTTYSQWLPLHVVPVSGPVTMHYDYDTGENYAVTALRFYCKAEKGSHPHYQWFHDKTLLQDRGTYYYVVDQMPQRSILLLSVGRESAGTYYCEVSDSFDNSTAISSKRRYLDKEVLNRIPDFVVGVVFGSFAFLIFLMSACCWIGVIFRKRQYGEKSLWSLEMQRSKAVYEDELDFSVHSDDSDLLKATREDEFDQASEDSEDEWPQIQKKTLKDEPV